MVKPHGTGHPLKGFNITGNRFKSLGTSIDRVDRVGTSFADLDYFGIREVNFANNSFHGVSQPVSNPEGFRHTAVSAATTWTVDGTDYLPFNGQALAVDSVVAVSRSNVVLFPTPAVDFRKGTNFDQIKLTREQPVRGAVQCGSSCNPHGLREVCTGPTIDVGL